MKTLLCSLLTLLALTASGIAESPQQRALQKAIRDKQAAAQKAYKAKNIPLYDRLTAEYRALVAQASELAAREAASKKK
jgi:hypothetical protein